MKRREPQAEPRLSAWLRPVVYTLAAGLFAAPLVAPAVALCVSLGAGSGAALGRVLARSRVRGLTLVVLAALGAFASLWVRQLLLASPGLAAWLGPAGALVVGDAVGFGGAALCLAIGVRAAALRVSLLRVVEVGFVAIAFAQLVLSHRNGAINRPFELADSILAAGGDPALWLLGIGAVAAVVSVLLLLGEQSIWRSLLHLTLTLLLLSLILTGTRMLGLPQPEVGSSGLGLRPGDDGKQAKEKPGGGGQGGDARQSNEELEFRDNYDTSGRTIPLAVVLLHDDYSPPGGLYYFRQSAFSQFNGQRLVSAMRDDVDRDLATRFALDTTYLDEVPNAAGDRVKLETTVALLADHNRPFALETPRALRPADNPDPGRFRRVYRVESEAFASDYEDLLGRRLGNPRWNGEQRAHYLGYPDDTRYPELAHEIIRELPDALAQDAMAQAVMITMWLGREGIYSLKSGHAGAADPTGDFLFGDRTGYCVHFAHAAVYLMRSLGIPSRVGAGYAVEESARQGGSAILLSGANSHAWPEVYVEDAGWVILDVAPQQTLDPPPAPPDVDLQRLLGEMARGLDPLPPSQDRPFEPAIRLARDAPGAIGRALAVLLPLLLLLAYTVKAWRRMIPWMVPAAAAPRLAYRAQLDRLSDVALRRRYGESRERFAARMLPQVPSLGDWTRGQVARAFGLDRGAPSRRELRGLSRQLRRELSVAVPFKRRLLGLLDPVSWLRTR